MALSIEEAFRPCAAVAYNLDAEFGGDSYEADLADLRALCHAVLAEATSEEINSDPYTIDREGIEEIRARIEALGQLT